MKKILFVLSLLFSVAYGQNIHYKNARLHPDSVYIGTFNTQISDTIYFFGDSYTAGVGASSNARRYATVASQKLGAIENNHGLSAELLQNRVTVNLYGAAHNMVQDTASIPTYTGVGGRFLVFFFGTNDATITTTNYTTTNYIADYTTVLNHATIRKGWPAAKILLISPAYIGTNKFAADSIAFSMPSAQTQTGYASYVTATNTVATTFGTKFLDIRTPQKNESGSNYLLLGSDSLHPTDVGHLFIANQVVKTLGYDIKRSNQVLTANGGLTELDSLKVRTLNPFSGDARTPVAIDSAGNFRSCEGCFLTNSPTQAQNFIGNTNYGITSMYAAPSWARITGAAGVLPTTAQPGIPITGEAIDLQYNTTSHAGYIRSYNNTTAAVTPLNIQYSGGYTAFGSGATQHNSSTVDINGILNTTGALWVTSTSASTGMRLLNGSSFNFIDAEGSGEGFKFRTNAIGSNAMALFSNGNASFGNFNDSAAVVNLAPGTTAKAQLYFGSSTAPTTPKNGHMWWDGSHLYFHSGDSTTNLLIPGAGGGGGGFSGLSTNYIPKATSSTTVADSRVADDGTTISMLYQGYRSLWGTGGGTNLNVAIRGAMVLLADSGASTRFVNVGTSMAQANSAVFQVNGVSDFSQDIYVSSTSSSTGLRIVNASGNNFFDAKGTGEGFNFRTNANTLNAGHFDGAHNGALTLGSTTNQALAQLEVVATSGAQLSLINTSTHHADFTMGATSVLALTGVNGLTIPTGSLPTGATTDSALVATNSAGTSTVKAVAISDIANSGTYTPTITNGTNIAGSTTATCYWHRIGNIVSVSGSILFSLTSASVSSQVDFSLPVASNFTGSGDAAGLMAGPNMLGATPISASAANDRITVLFTGSTTTTSQTNSFNFSYIVQ